MALGQINVKAVVREAVEEALAEVLDELLGRKPAAAQRPRKAAPVAPMPLNVQVRKDSKPPRAGSNLRRVYDAMLTHGPIYTGDSRVKDWLKQDFNLTPIVLKQLWNGGYLEEATEPQGASA